jgi:hypothetical protein
MSADGEVSWCYFSRRFNVFISDPKCYNPRVLKSLCHDKRQRSEGAKQFFRSGGVVNHNDCQSQQKEEFEPTTSVDADSASVTSSVSLGDGLTCNGTGKHQ